MMSWPSVDQQAPVKNNIELCVLYSKHIIKLYDRMRNFEAQNCHKSVVNNRLGAQF